MAVVASATGAAVFGLSGVAAGLAGGALLGAGAGALYSGLTGDGNILNSALTGALLGGAAGGLGAAFAAPSVTAPTTLASAPISSAVTPTANVLTATPAAQAAGFKTAATAAPSFSAAPTISSAAGLKVPTMAVSGLPAAVTPIINPAITGSAGTVAKTMTGGQMLGYGLAGTTALSLLGGKQKGPGAGQLPDPGMVRPYEYSSTPNEPTGTYPSPYATAEYDESGNPILDTRERNYFSQSFEPMQPYSAKAGTVNPNEPFKMAAAGGLMYDDSYGMDEARGLMQGNLQKGLFGQGYAAGGQIDMGNGYNPFSNLPPMSGALGAVRQDMTTFDPNFNKPNFDAIRNSINSTNTTTQQDVMGGDRRVNPLNFSEIMGGGLSSMFNQPTGQSTPLRADPMQSGFGQGAQGYPSFNQNPNTSMGGFTGPSSSYGSSNGSSGGAFPLEGKYGIIKMADGGKVKHMFGGGLTAIVDRLMAENPRMFMPKYEYDNATQRYNTISEPQTGNMGGVQSYRFDPAEQEYKALAAGGHLGDYSDGGRLLKGPGDGVSDDIPATIAGKQPARLADGEFVIPARIVSELGNGSTDAGAKRLYAMMDRIQNGRKQTIGKKNVAKDTKAKKHLLA
jgi:hypothetical protein